MIYYPQSKPRKLVIFSYGKNGKRDYGHDSDDLSVSLTLDTSEIIYDEYKPVILFQNPDNIRINEGYLTEIPAKALAHCDESK